MIGLRPTTPISLTEAPPSRDHVIRRLQFASIIIAWTVLVITFSSTLGTSSMFIGLWTAIGTLTFEGYLVRRRRREQREERVLAPGEPSDSVGVHPGQQPSGSATSKGTAGPAPYNAQAQVPPSTTASTPDSVTQVPPTTHVELKLSGEYRWPFIMARAILTILWILSFVAALVVTIVVGGRWGYERTLPARIIEIIISFGMIGVQGALLVLCIKERERILSLNGIVLYL